MTLQKQSMKASKPSENKPQFRIKKFGPKALDFLAYSDAPINIAHGAVRSSKTITATIRWLQFIGESPHTEFLQSGKTRSSLYRNVLRDQMKIMDSYGINYKHSAYDGTLTIEDKTIWLLGFRDERVSDIVRGMTIGGWYADETNTYPKSAVEEALDRCSLSDSKVFWTMNPDSPYHYIYTDYITNQALVESEDVKTWHYVLEDNPHLPPSYVEQIKRRYPEGSVQYKRKILGLWVIAEGVIYDRFIESQHTFKDRPYNTYDKYVVSTDYGISTVTVFGYWGIKYHPEGNEYHLLREWYYDAQQKGRQLTDTELIDNALKLVGENRLDTFYVPHDAASLKAEASTRTLYGQPIPIYTYTPNVLEDISIIQSCFNNNQILFHESCRDSIQQAQSYAWDQRAQQRGEDRPLKTEDHAPDMWRAAIIGTRQGHTPYTTSNSYYDYNSHGNSRPTREVKNFRRGA